MSDNELVLNRAKAAVLSRDYALAVRLYKTLLKQKPQDVELLTQLGSLYVKSGNDNLALPVFKEIILLKSDDFNALNNLGGIYRRLKKYSESVAVLEQALATGENDAQVSYNLGFTYKLMGNYDDAVECFEDVVAENPSDVLAFNHIGSIRAQQGDNEKAIASYERGLKIDPNHPVLQLNLAKSCEALGKYDKAIGAYETALRSKPGWLEAIDGYANLLLKLNRTREATDVVLQAIRLNPKDVKMHTSLGTVYTRQSDFKNAKGEYKEALSSDENYDPALTGLANAQEQLGENDEAVATMQKVEEHKPEDPEVLKQFAHILISANHLNAASQKLEKLWKKNPNDVQVLNLLGQYYICKGNAQKVNGAWKLIDTINPTYYDHYKDGAERYRQIGELSQSEKFLLKYLDKKPKDPAAITALAAEYEALKKFSDALALYRKASDLDKNNVMTKNGIKRIKDQLTKVADLLDTEDLEEMPEEARADVNADFETGSSSEIKMDATDSEFETSEEKRAAEAEAQKKNDFDFDQFGIENLAKEEPINPVFFEDTESMGDGAPIDADERTLDDLADDDEQPIDADDEIQSTPVGIPSPVADAPQESPSQYNPFTAEKIGPDDTGTAMDTAIPENPSEQQNMMPDSEPEPDLKSDVLSEPESKLQCQRQPEDDSESIKAMEKKLKTANEAAEKALFAAQQAWSAAQRAADSAQAADDARNNQKPLPSCKEQPEEENPVQAEAPAEDDDDKGIQPLPEPKPLKEEPRSIALGKDMLPLSGSDIAEANEELRKTTALFEKAVNTLPAIVNVLIDQDMIEKFQSSLEMFKRLKALSEYLPPVKREAFMSSRTRLLLDYIIAKLSGEPGLLATSEALRKSGVLMNMASSPMPTESGVALVTRVLSEMRGYISALPDPSLGRALDATVADTLQKL